MTPTECSQRILNEKGEEIAEMEFKYMGGSALF